MAFGCYRYKNHCITAMENQSRSDKGSKRKVTPEEVLEAINILGRNVRKAEERRAHGDFFVR